MRLFLPLIDSKCFITFKYNLYFLVVTKYTSIVTIIGGLNMRKAKSAFAIMMVLICSVLSAGFAAAAPVPVTLERVWIDGNAVSDIMDFEKGGNIEIKVKLEAHDDAKNVQVEAELKGFEYDDKFKTEDTTHVFDVEEGIEYIKYLALEVPDKMENDEYQLRITITDRDNDERVYSYTIKVSSERHSLQIRDVDFTPASGVEAGKSLLTKVRIKNIGQKDEESVKVTVAIPDLGVSASSYIDEIEADDTESSEEMWIRVPECAEAGVYQAVVRVMYDEMFETVYAAKSIEIVSGDLCPADAEEEEEEAAPIIVPAAPAPKQDEGKEMLRSALEVGLVGLLVALIIIALVAGMVALRKNKGY